MKTVTHTFMPSQTIHAVIRRVNQQDVSDHELRELMAMFIELNGAEVPRAREARLIPVLDRHATSAKIQALGDK